MVLDDADKRGLKPRELLADSQIHITARTSVWGKAKKRGMKIISPTKTAKGKLQGKLTPEDNVRSLMA